MRKMHIVGQKKVGVPRYSHISMAHKNDVLRALLRRNGSRTGRGKFANIRSVTLQERNYIVEFTFAFCLTTRLATCENNSLFLIRTSHLFCL